MNNELYSAFVSTLRTVRGLTQAEAYVLQAGLRAIDKLRQDTPPDDSMLRLTEENEVLRDRIQELTDIISDLELERDD